jgi:hypothetical protein
MFYEGNRAGRDSDDGNGRAEHLRRDTGRSIRSRTPVPPTVLVTGLDSGVLILQGRPDGPCVSLRPGEAIPLRRELAAAFVNTEPTPQGIQDGTR